MKNTNNDFIFVFGSNLAGRHGKGAALHARKRFGAEYGVGMGRTGRSYAIPTKDVHLRTIPLEQIDHWVSVFISYVKENPDLIFLLTPIGTGLAGHNKKDIAKIFRRYRCFELDNILLTSSWLK